MTYFAIIGFLCCFLLMIAIVTAVMMAEMSRVTSAPPMPAASTVVSDSEC